MSSALHFVPPAPALEADIAELQAVVASRLVGVARPHQPVPAIVDRIASELGIRQPAVGGYGPTSALSEDLLLRGYGLRRPRVEDEP